MPFIRGFTADRCIPNYVVDGSCFFVESVIATLGDLALSPTSTLWADAHLCVLYRPLESGETRRGNRIRSRGSGFPAAAADVMYATSNGGSPFGQSRSLPGWS